jgi:hypothetical protein
MRILVVVAAMAVLAIATVTGAVAQERDRYLLLATSRTGTMQAEINAAAATGYRAVAASRTEGAEVIVVLERTIGSYQYRLLATTKTSTLQRELEEAADAGYRVVPRAITTKRGGGLRALAASSNEGELLIVMEKGPEATAKAQYQLVATSKTGTLQKEMSEAAANGYVLLALVSRGEHLAILERVPGQ